MQHIAALPALVLLQRTNKYASVRASLAPCTVQHLKSLYDFPCNPIN